MRENLCKRESPNFSLVRISSAKALKILSYLDTLNYEKRKRERERRREKEREREMKNETPFLSLCSPFLLPSFLFLSLYFLPERVSFLRSLHFHSKLGEREPQPNKWEFQRREKSREEKRREEK